MVLVEGFSVIVRKDTIEKKYPAGWIGYVHDAPNSAFCADDNISCIGFKTKADVNSFIKSLEEISFEYLIDGKPSEIALVDPFGIEDTPSCDWIEILRFKNPQNQNYIYACRLKGDNSTDFYAPKGWDYDQSLSSK